MKKPTLHDTLRSADVVTTNSNQRIVNLSFYFGLALSFTVLIWISLNNALYFDDGFITLRIAKNFWLGNGLYHNLQEKVQTNTSILYPVLVSPFFMFSDATAIRLNLLFDSLLLGGATVLGFRLVYSKHVACLPTIWAAILGFAFPFSIALGFVQCLSMETQLYLFFITLTFYYASIERWNLTILVSLILPYIRPEGILVPLVICLFWLPKILTRQIRVPIWLPIVSFCIIGLYPTFIYGYYGSIIPQTVLVKRLLDFTPLASFHYLITHILFNPKDIIVFIMSVSGFWLFVGFREKSLRLPAIWLTLYMAFFTFGAGWSAFYGWYKSPIRLFLSLFFITFTIQSYVRISWQPLRLLAILSYLLLVGRLSYNYVRNNQLFDEQDRILAATDLNKITDNQAYSVTLEPLGVMSFYNMNCTFKDFPGLASKYSYSLIKDAPKISFDSFFTNKTYLTLIQNTNSQLIVLRRAEFDFYYPKLDHQKLLLLGRIGNPRTHEFNGFFYVLGNLKTLSKLHVVNLKDRLEDLEKERS